jgi:type II secretory pathway predicted ATPase ExeA
MDPVQNPFSPGAGTPPPELAGRGELLEEARIMIGRALNGRSTQGMLMTGLRGVGKTVILNELMRMAEEQGALSLFVEATAESTLSELLASELKKLFISLNRIAGTADKVKKGLVVLRNFIGAVHLKVGDIGLDIEPFAGIADSGNIETDLADLFECVAEAAKEKNKAVLLLVDEVQYLPKKELGALIMAFHRLQQRQLPFAVIGAGLPMLAELAGKTKSYAERLFLYPQVDALTFEATRQAIETPFASCGVQVERRAVEKVYEQSKGHPYFIQEWGYQIWNRVERKRVGVDDIDEVRAKVVKRLDENFFHARLERLTAGEKDFLHGMALCSGNIHVADVAKALGSNVASLSKRRASLLAKGMIYSPRYGELAFTVPMFGQFMRRSRK